MCVAVSFLEVCGREFVDGGALVSRTGINQMHTHKSIPYLKARNRDPGCSGLDGDAQTSRGALTVQKARMLHCYQLQELA